MATTVNYHNIYKFKIMNGPYVYDTATPMDVYCFEKPDSAQKVQFIDFFFIGKVCIYKHKRLYIGYEFNSKREVGEEMRLLFPKRVTKNANYKDCNGDYWKSYEYVGNELIESNGTVYKDCLKMEIFETFGHTRKIGTVRVAKNVGLVKWRVTKEKASFRHYWPINKREGKINCVKS